MGWLQHSGDVVGGVNLAADVGRDGPAVRKMLVASLVLGVALVSISAAHWHRTSATSGPPNIVVILLDDARYDDMSTMTRVVRAIGDQGATFRRFYASFPLCCPARATLFTGE
jgi:N-acetylglucosamine-6-sulfatase